MQTTEIQTPESRELTEVPYTPCVEFEKLERLSQHHDLQVRDVVDGDRYDVLDIRPLGVVIQDRGESKMITYNGENNLQSGRYRVVVCN